MSKLSDVFVVGLTGQSGSGKTTVSDVFRENGFEVINADFISRKVMEKGSECLNEVSESFENVLFDDGTLNRKKLAEYIFSDKDKKELLNSITYPYITREVLHNIEEMSQNNKNLILLDAPTLFESRADDFCELVISIVSDKESRIERIIERDGISRELAEKRLASQYDNKFYIDNSDYIIKNNKTVEELKLKAKEVSDKIKEFYDAKKNI